MDTSLFSTASLMAILTLTFLEIILGIDNIVFISIVTGKLKEADRPRARRIGLFLALFFRIIMLFGLTWILKLNNPFLSFNNNFIEVGISGQSLIVFFGGLFLLYKSVTEIHEKMEGAEHSAGSSASSVSKAIIQIALLNLVFSFDSILTAIGLVSLAPPPVGFGYATGMEIMIISVIISILIMLKFAGPVSEFVNNHPTIQILGLSFLILIGVMLVAEGAHMAHLRIMHSIAVHSIPKGYLYFGIIFSLFIEMLNMRMRKSTDKKVKLNDSEIQDKELY
ncbi:MAG: TerC family protein [Chitinophagales bacterium]|nr:TerC family protein [Chitinophagales bacterium]